MFRLFFQIFSLIFILLGATAHSAVALDIKNVRFGAHANKTRMVIELSGASEYRAFMLPKIDDKPYRLVVDLPDFEWKAGSIPKPPKTTVMDVRSGNLKPGIMRVVIDLEKPAQLKTAFLMPKAGSKPNRLVIDFATLSKSAFDKTKRKIMGRLEEGAADLNLIIAKQTEQNIRDGANTPPKKTAITPTRKPATTQKTFQEPVKQKPKTPLRKPLIVIDAGHGGADPGAIGAGRLREKNITLAMAKELKSQLEKTGRYNVALTRSSDKYLKLSKRVSIARHKEADLFMSLHADSINKPKVSGASIYTLSNTASDKQTAKLAARENQVDLIAGVDLSHEDKDVANILIDLAMRDTMNQSKFFANTVVDKMGRRGIRILEKPHRYAGFAVLKAPDIPSVLVEMGFMSNKKEAKLLSTKGYQQKIASALVESIDSYFAKVHKNNGQ